MELGSNTWFVRIDDKIRGPFNAQVIHSMKSRGRITPSSELSSDRREWYSAYDFGDLFTEPVAVQDAVMVHATGGEIGYFYNNQGVQTGPVTVQRLQELAAMGVLIETDLVWYEGAPDWFPASGLSELTFPKQTQTAQKWVFQNKVLACIVAASLLVAVVVPMWYILSLNSARTTELREKAKTQDASVRAAQLVALRQERSTLDERLDSLKAQRKAANEAMANGGANSLKMLGVIGLEIDKVTKRIEENEEKQLAEEKIRKDAEERSRRESEEKNLLTTVIGIAAGLMTTIISVAYMMFRAIGARGSGSSSEREIMDARREIYDAKREITDALRDLKK
ncbi:MAG: GYF domain-containing protein [Mariniblastus sp.]